MNITTPKTQQTGFEKRLHTPPTIERVKGRTTPTKFLKGLSNNIFKKNFEPKEQHAAKLDSDVKDFHFSQIPKMVRRFKTPKPLDLSKPLSPPMSVKKYEELNKVTPSQGSFQSSENINLSSPVILQSLNYNRPKNLTNLLYDALDSPMMENEQSLNTDYCECNDLLSYHSKKSLLMNTNSAKYFKRFVGEECCICKEAISHNFIGEKIVQLSCSHLTHFNCYLTLYESGLNNGALLMCGICNVGVSPKDPELVNLLASTLSVQTKKRTSMLSSRVVSTTKTVVSDQSRIPTKSCPQYFELKSAKILDSTFKSYTPIDQLIKSADISCNGFTGFQNELEDKMLHDTESSECLSLESETLSLFHSVSPSTISKTSFLDKILPTVIWHENNNRVSIEVKFNSDVVDKGGKGKVSINELEEKGKDVIYFEILQFIRGELLSESLTDVTILNELRLFDTVTYSTDNNVWHNNILIFFVDDIIILFNYIMNKVVAKFQLTDIAHIHKLTGNVLIIDTKTRKIPEIFLRFNTDYLTKKWKFYLQNPRYPFTNHLNHITNTALFILPDTLKYKIQETRDNNENINIPWLVEDESPLKLILCLNLCSISTKDPRLYRDKLVTAINRIISSLSEKDMLGLVTLGPKTENSRTPYSSTYVGMISKEWKEWKCIINDLEVSTCQEEMYPDKIKELETILQACFKLISTFSEDESTGFRNHILYLNQFDDMETDISDLVLNNKLQDVIFNKHQFHMSGYNIYDYFDTIEKVVDNLHHMKYYNLRVKINEEVIYIGNVNDVKKVIVDNSRLLDIIKTASECEVSWEERGEDSSFSRTVPLSRYEE